MNVDKQSSAVRSRDFGQNQSIAKNRAKIVKKPGWDLVELDRLSDDAAGFTEPDRSKPYEKPVVPIATSTLELHNEGVGLEKKSVQMKSRWVPLVCLACVGALALWASFAKIDQVTRGSGKVIPSSKVQTIQSLDDGIVVVIPVTEGDIVEKGQAVLELDDTVVRANYQETMARRDLVLARMARLQAEANGFTDPVYPDTLNPEVVFTENELFNTRRKDYLARKRSVENLLSHARSELEVLRLGQESMTKLDIIRAQRDVATLEGNLSALNSEASRNALDTRDALRTELATLNGALARSDDALHRKVLRSPTHGTVNKIHIAGEGGVIRGGESVMEIVPINDTLLVEANIRPEDIGFIHSDQNATVKFTAYDFTIYGGMEGVVEYIGVDTVINDQGETYYPVRIRTESTTMGSKDGRELTIIPGMVAEVDVLAGQKSVLQYLLTPLNRAREKALTEQ